MNRDDIIRMADKAKFEICSGDGWPDERRISKLVRFADLVAAAERETIIQFLQEMQRAVGDAHNHYGVAAVRIKAGI